MGRTRHTRKRHTRRKHKRKRTRHRRRTRRGSGSLNQGPPRGGFKENFNVVQGLVGSHNGWRTKIAIVSDFPPGFRDKAARAAFRKMKRKSRKHKRKRKSRKHKRKHKSRKHKRDAENIKIFLTLLKILYSTSKFLSLFRFFTFVLISCLIL